MPDARDPAPPSQTCSGLCLFSDGCSSQIPTVFFPSSFYPIPQIQSPGDPTGSSLHDIQSPTALHLHGLTLPLAPSFLTCISCQAPAGLHFLLSLRAGGSFTHRSQVMSRLGSERVPVLRLLRPPSSSLSAPRHCPLLSSSCSPAIAQTPACALWPSGRSTSTWSFPPPGPLFHGNCTG